MTRARGLGADIVVLTALGLEYDAVRTHLTGTRGHTDANGTRYEIGALHGGPCRVALALIGEGNLAAAALTGRAIEEFRPRTLALVGIAGGLADDVDIGAVVVATRIYAYHGGRAETGGFRPRPKGWPLSHGLEQVAREVAQGKAWTRPRAEDAGGIAVHFKPIVSGEVVLDSRESPIAELIAEHYADAVAIDMESAGVAEAAHRKDFLHAITIRSISDATDGNKRHADAAGWQHVAAANAAAFAVALAERVVVGPATTVTGVGPCPYRGLAAFTERDASLFFGRTELAGELAGLVSRTRFVAVVGRSGSGKSSLVHAGVVPRLRRHGWAIAGFRPLPDVPAAIVLAGGLLPLLRPGLDPVAALRERAAVANAITAGRLPELVGDVLTETGASQLLVCVDQFEELIARNESAARDLTVLLLQLSTGAARAHVLVTMRTETLDVAVHRLGLGEASRHSVFLLTPMRPDELRSAIEAPAAPAGARFEPGLVERILESATDAPAALPLVQFALTRLWDEQHHGLLTHAAYDGFGGVGGALAGYAERVWTTELNDIERHQARRLLVQLVRPDGGSDAGSDGGALVRRTARAGELEPDLVPLAGRLATTRLLVAGTGAGGEPTYDLAHAALATHWHRLRDWLREERDFRAWQEDLRESIRREEPVRGPRLTHAVRWLRDHPDGITTAERAFITTSHRHQRRRTTAWRGGVALIAALLVVATTFAITLRQRTGELADELRQGAAAALVTQSRDQVSSQPDTAALMAVAAYRADPDPAVLANLAGEYLRYRSTTRLLDPGVGVVEQVTVSPDGKAVAALGTGGTAVWRLDRSPPTREFHRWRPKSIVLNHDATLLAGAFVGGRIEVLRQDGTVVRLGEAEPTAPRASTFRFDPTGRRLLTIVEPDGLVVWDIARRATVALPDDLVSQADRVGTEVWFGPGPDSLVVATDELAVWHLNTRTATVLAPLDDESDATVARHGRTAVACVADELVRWELTTPRERDRRPLPAGDCPLPTEFSTDGTGPTVVAAPRNRPPEGRDHPRSVVSLLDLDTYAVAYPVTPMALSRGAGVGSVASTATGTRLVTTAGTAVAVVDVDRAGFPEFNQLLNPGSTVSGIVFSEDGRRLATVSTKPKRRVQLWDTASGKELASAAAEPDLAVPLSFTADGALLLALDHAPFDTLFGYEVPSLRSAAQLPLPTGPVAPESNSTAFTGICVGDTAPDTVAVLYAGLISRFDPRSGAPAGQPVKLWRTEDELWRLASTSACAVRPGHHQMAFGVSSDVEIWDLDTGRRVATLRIPVAGAIRSVRFSPDGSSLAALSEDGAVQVWDVEQRTPLADPLAVLGPGGSAGIVGFPGPDQIIVENDRELRVWDLDRRAAIANLDLLKGPNRAAIAGDDVLVWSDSGLVRMPLDPQRWATHLCRIVGRDLTETERHTLPPGTPTEPICPRYASRPVQRRQAPGHDRRT